MDDNYEIHSILEFGDIPSNGLWWVLSPAGKSPSISAGAASLLETHSNGYHSSITLSGGATPAGFVNEINKLDLILGKWKSVPNESFQPRYEHAMCFDENKNMMVILGSSNEGSPPAQVLENNIWTKINLSISQRTVSQSTVINGKTFIWSGGSQSGVIVDSAVYIIENGKVRKEKISGELPCPRQEFAMTADDKFLYVQGGLDESGSKLGDLYRINLKSFRSKKCQLEEPLTRAMHKMVIKDDKLFIFGGLTESDIISDNLYQLTPVDDKPTRFTRKEIIFETKPTPRIAFNFNIIDLPIRKESKIIDDKQSSLDNSPKIEPIDDWKVTIDGENVKLNEETEASENINPDDYTSIPVLFIYGGCDSEGEFFNDIFVSCIP